MSNLNRFGESREQAVLNSRRELDRNIPLIPKKQLNVKPDWVDKELKRLKRAWKFDLAAKLGEKMYRGAFPAILKRWEKEYMTVAKLS